MRAISRRISTTRRAAIGKHAVASASASRAFPSSPATSIATGCSAASSASDMRWRSSMASIRATCCRRARSQEQRAYFDQVLAPLFDKRLIRWFADRPISLYGLGIPPAQYEALAGAGPGGMSSILRQRVEKLTCSFSLNDNYFAWQALGRVLCQGRTRPAAALSARGAFRRDPQPRRSRAGAQSLRHRIPAGRARAIGRPLCAARRAGLDDRCAAQRAVARDHPHRAARRPRDLPHRRRAEPAARPARRRDPRSLALRGRAIARSHRCATVPPSMAASIST